ncbi:MAG: FKBP-type peptidyl-prolyl cis-trans isomerase [Gemmatimonadota bacterium]|nr:FKBP-type peptidyl-prolyl cis-trans isomerase [Gemmatimonadota bacterium]
MHAGRELFAVILLSTVVACQGSETPSLETDNQKASYGIGLNMGGQIEPASGHIDVAALRAGIEDAMAGRESRLTDEELQASMQVFNETIQAEMQAEAEALGETNAAEGDAYLTENATRAGVTTTSSGLQYEVLREGDGASPEPGDQVTIHYRGTLIDGTQFDSSYDRDTPATFSVGGVIPGFSEGLQLMTVGSQYRLVIPGGIGYGPGGNAPDIGPNATLIFEVELLEIPGS